MKRYFILMLIFLVPCAGFAQETPAGEKPPFIQAGKPASKDTLLPEIFLTGKTFGKRMLFSDDKDVFLAYLFVIKNFTGDVNGQTGINSQNIKNYLYPEKTKEKTDMKTAKILDILSKKYELIEFDRYLKENAKIKLLSLKEDHAPYKNPALDYLIVPETLWSFGWEKRLSFTALYTFLISLMEKKLTPFDSHWSIDPEMLALKYNLSLRQIQQGLEELRQYSLLEAVNTGETNIFNNKPVVKYKDLPLYSWGNAEAQWKKIKTTYNKNDIKKASKYAAVLYKRFDPEAVEEILKLMKQFPANKLKKAFNILDEKPAASEERSFDYLKKILNNI